MIGKLLLKLLFRKPGVALLILGGLLIWQGMGRFDKVDKLDRKAALVARARARGAKVKTPAYLLRHRAAARANAHQSGYLYFGVGVLNIICGVLSLVQRGLFFSALGPLLGGVSAIVTVVLRSVHIGLGGKIWKLELGKLMVFGFLAVVMLAAWSERRRKVMRAREHEREKAAQRVDAAQAEGEGS